MLLYSMNIRDINERTCRDLIIKVLIKVLVNALLVEATAYSITRWHIALHCTFIVTYPEVAELDRLMKPIYVDSF